MQKNGVTLIELLIVIIIIAILVAVGTPVYTNRIERTRGERAIANIELIVSAYKMYLVKYDTHPLGTGKNNSLVGINEINDILDSEISDDNFTYNINYSDPGVDTIARIRAIRGGDSGRFIQYKYDYSDGDPDTWAASKWDWMP